MEPLLVKTALKDITESLKSPATILAYGTTVLCIYPQMLGRRKISPQYSHTQETVTYTVL